MTKTLPSKIIYDHVDISAISISSFSPLLFCRESSQTYKDAIFLSPHKFVGGPGTPGMVTVRLEKICQCEAQITSVNRTGKVSNQTFNAQRIIKFSEAITSWTCLYCFNETLSCVKLSTTFWEVCFPIGNSIAGKHLQMSYRFAMGYFVFVLNLLLLNCSV